MPANNSNATAAQLYLETLMARLSAWHQTSLPEVATAGRSMARAVAMDAGRLVPYSGRADFFSEASGTAGGLMGVSQLEPSYGSTGAFPYNP